MKVISDRDIEQFYQVLELPAHASQADVKSAFRKLARQYHPDRFSGDRDNLKAAEERFKSINAAYEFLKNHEPKTLKTSSSSSAKASSSYNVEVKVNRVAIDRTPAAFVQEARRWKGLGNLQEAIMALDTAIALEDDYYPAYELRSELRLMLGNAYGSKMDLRRAKHFRWVYKSEGRSIDPMPKATSKPKTSSEPSSESSFAERAKEIFARTQARSQVASNHSTKKATQAKPSKPSTTHSANPPKSTHSGQSKRPPETPQPTQSSPTQPAQPREKPSEKPAIPQPKLLQTFQGHLDSISQVLLTSRSLISASHDGSVRIWSTETGKLEGTLTVGAAVTAIVACPTSNLFITGDRSGKIKMWNLMERKLIRSLPLHTGTITGIHFSPNGKAFATTGEDGILKLFQLQPASLRHSLQVSTAPIFASGLLGGRFFTTTADSKLRGIDSGKIIQESDLSSPLCKAMAINIQKKWVAIGDDRASVHCFSTNGDLVKSFAAFPEGGIRSLEFLAGGDRLLVAGASPLIKIWDVTTWDLVMEWTIGTGHSTAVAASGKRVAIGLDQTIQLWQLP
jgi:COMPASS component SWD3